MIFYDEKVGVRDSAEIPTHSLVMAEASDRLEPFLLIARSTKGAAAVKIIESATAAVRHSL